MQVTMIDPSAPAVERGQQLARALFPAFVAACDPKEPEQTLEFFAGFLSISMSYAAAALGADAVKRLTDQLSEIVKQNEQLLGKPGGHA